MCLSPYGEALRREGRCVLGQGTSHPRLGDWCDWVTGHPKPSQKLVLRQVLRCPSASWVKKKQTKPTRSLEDDYQRRALWFSSLDGVQTLQAVQCSLSPPPQFTPSLPEFMKGIMQFPLFRTLCQLTSSYQWEPFFRKGCRSIGLAVFHELLIYSEFVSC